jgi:hypothetical protein
VHAACLRKLFADNESDEVPRCTVCREPYSMQAEYRFAFLWRRCLSCRSVGHAFEFIVVLLMLCCGVYTLSVFLRSKEARTRHGDGSSNGAVLLIYGLFGLTVLLVPFTLVKVYSRWKKANATTILPV